MSCQCTNADVKSLDQQTNEICLLSAGFKVVTDVITSKKKRDLMWVVGLITFFMSAVLDNLTTTIVMVSLVKKVSTMSCFFLHSNVYLFAFYFHVIFIL
jgi:Na+/H+ antiporter NhaD/arsenite permease-like protein